MTEGAAYILEDVTFAYGERVALEVPRLEIPRGKVTAIVGANGAGKTTLLHLLGFIEPPRTGRITFFDKDVAPEEALDFRRRVGLLLQDPYLFHTSVLANVEWGLKLRRVPVKERRERAMRALEQVGLSGFERRAAPALSGGESKRLALARVLALETDVLLLDEPMSHMDRESAGRTEQVIRELNRERGVSVLLASPDILWAQALTDNVLSLHDGKIVPASLANVFRGRITDAGRSFETAKISIYLGAAEAQATHLAIDPSAIVTHLAIDPSAIVLSKEPLTSSMRNTLHGRVVAISEEAAKVRVEVDAGERFHVLITKKSLETFDLRLGDEVCLSFKSTAVKLF
ncbi:MAG: hypothetical protein AMS16_07275 [Planctomycetes bacterium DG_58]|nr:MAG: hypothetical protein AMS16_07275 [Planctomycetes bacterium DG_58]